MKTKIYLLLLLCMMFFRGAMRVMAQGDDDGMQSSVKVENADIRVFERSLRQSVQ